MNNHADFHDKEHYSPDCPKCREDKSRNNLLTEIEKLFLSYRAKIIKGEVVDLAEYRNAILAKIREAVEGAGLTPEGIQEQFLLYEASKPNLDMPFGWGQWIAEAQTQAILKALGGSDV